MAMDGTDEWERLVLANGEQRNGGGGDNLDKGGLFLGSELVKAVFSARSLPSRHAYF